MPSHLAPGVYVDEVPSGERSITGARTAVAGFIGQTGTGPFNTPTRITTWAEFSAVFGGFLPGACLAQSVHGFFLNGGGVCHIVRIGPGDPHAGVEQGGVEQGSASANDYIGDATRGTGLAGLEAISDITMLCAPDLMGAHLRGTMDPGSVLAVQAAMVSQAASMRDRMAILDAPSGLTAHQVRQWRSDAHHDSAFAALYWPWLRCIDPVSGSPSLMPPSGHVAGIWCRSDAARGVQRAPANEVVRGPIGLEVAVTPSENTLLNPEGINVIRSFPGRGIRVWGARSLSSDPGWRYLNVRRLVSYLEQSILEGTTWVVFEQNDETLWARVRGAISAFLITQWRNGALMGATPRDAFFVKCDSETNTAEDIARGHVVCTVGVAAARPAEFVIFRITQSTGGANSPNE